LIILGVLGGQSAILAGGGGMNLSETLPTLHALPRPEKWRLIQLLVADLAREEGIPPIEAGSVYPIWSPYHAFDAADAMLKALAEEAGE
jgi:hypothetical protein